MPDAMRPATTVTPLPPCIRYSIRTLPSGLALLEDLFGESFPTQVGQVSGMPDRFVSCLGPDEWSFVAPGPEKSRLASACAELPEHFEGSITDISAREVGYLIEGAEAATLLNSGCPRNLRGMPTPSAARTVFDGVAIGLVKWQDDAFRLDVWRSFVPHIRACLDLALNDLV
ncbi:MAG: hypothetical protein MRY64_08375 [Hyphomonadaceae bacterium]|nr:hypothetical protein [Hyphomonadaceae bacterium]